MSYLDFCDHSSYFFHYWVVYASTDPGSLHPPFLSVISDSCPGFTHVGRKSFLPFKFCISTDSPSNPINTYGQHHFFFEVLYIHTLETAGNFLRCSDVSSPTGPGPYFNSNDIFRFLFILDTSPMVSSIIFAIAMSLKRLRVLLCSNRIKMPKLHSDQNKPWYPDKNTWHTAQDFTQWVVELPNIYAPYFCPVISPNLY